MRGFVTVAAAANYAVTLWHLYVAEQVNPALVPAEAVRIAVFAGVLTLVGVGLLWTRHRKVGSVVLIGVFAVGLIIGSAEHFFVPGPNNVFDVSNAVWSTPFKTTVVMLLVLEIAGLSGAGRVLLTRSSRWLGA